MLVHYLYFSEIKLFGEVDRCLRRDLEPISAIHAKSTDVAQ